mgnify:FL=1
MLVGTAVSGGVLALTSGAGSETLVLAGDGTVSIPSKGLVFNQAFGTGVPSITMTGTANNGRGGAINFKESNGSGGAIADTAAIYSTDGAGGNSNYGGLTIAAYQSDIRFSTGTLAGTKMTVKSDGNVGIGTASPVASSNKTVLGIQGAWGGQVDIMVGSTVHAQFGTDNFSTGQSCRIQSQDGIVFKAGGSTERMRISNTGVLTSKSHVITGIDNNAFEVKTNHSGNPSAVRVAGSGSINGVSGSFQNFTVLNVMQDSGSTNSIYAAGNIKTDGNINIGTSGKGISFSVNPNASGMGSELLDDYEEGSWTPTLGTELVTGSGASSANNNRYVKIGRLVHVTGWYNAFPFSSITSGTYLMLRGLPFRPEHHSTGFSFKYTQSNFAGGTYGYGHTSLYACYIMVGGSTGAGVHVTRTAISAPSSATTHLMIDATYYTDD